MTTESNPNGSNFDDDVTLAASDRSIQEIRADGHDGDDGHEEIPVWTTEDDATRAPGTLAEGAHTSLVAESFEDEPTIIRGFGEELTTPLDDRARSQVAGLRSETESRVAEVPGPAAPTAAATSAPAPTDGAPSEAAPTEAGPTEAGPPEAGPRILGASLIDGAQPPASTTSFFEVSDLAPESRPERARSTGRRARFPMTFIVVGVLLIAVTITVVLAVLLGTSGL